MSKPGRFTASLNRHKNRHKPSLRPGVRIGDLCFNCSDPITNNSAVYKGNHLQPRCRICFNAHSNDVPSRSYESRSKQYVEWKFGLSWEEYNRKVELQLGGCAICKKPCETRKRLSVDHNHKTGQVRDLLCIRCNWLLGMVEEDEILLLNVLEYIKKHNAKFAA